MPRVALTAAQKEAYILDRRAQWLANGLAAYRNKEHLSIKQFGRMVGLSDKTISRLLKADREVTLSITMMWRLEAIARRAQIQITEEGDEAG